MRKILLSSLLLLSTLLPSSAAGFESIPVYKGEYVRNIETVKEHEVFYHFNGVLVNLTISYEASNAEYLKGRYPVKMIKKNLVISHDLTLELLKERKINAEICKRPYHAHVFILSRDTMYNSGMFDSLMKEQGINAVYALMDKTYEIKGNNNFLFADRGDWDNYQSLQHEFAHYWHDRYCLWDEYPDTEYYADMMENRAERAYIR